MKGFFHRFMARRDTRGPIEAMSTVLAANGPTVDIPSQVHFCKVLWLYGGSYIVIGTILALVIKLVLGTGAACIAGTVFLLGFVVLTYFMLRAALASSALERGIGMSAYLLSALMLVKASGLKIAAGAGQNQPWFSRVEFGDENTHLIWAAVVVFAVGQCAVVGIQYVKNMR